MSWVRSAALLAVSAGLLGSAEIPRPAPDFSVLLPEGGELQLSHYRGKVVVLEFLITTCPHCQHAAQLLTQMQEEYGPKGFQAIGCSFDPMPRLVVPDFVKNLDLKHPVGYSFQEQVYSFVQVDPGYAVHVPQLVFIDRKGMIRNQSAIRGDAETAKEENVRKWIELLVGEPGGSPRKPAAAKTKS